MKLAELLNVDTTKDGWFKLFQKKGINPKTVNIVSKGGGGEGGEVKEWYYKFNTDKLLEDFSDNPSGAVFTIGYFSYYVGLREVGSTKMCIEYQTNITTDSITTEFLKNTKGAKVVDSMPIFEIISDTTGSYPVYIYGNYWQRMLVFTKVFAPNVTLEQVKESLLPYITEISKEEYETLIEIPNVILGKE